MTTTDKAKAAVQVTAAIAESIRELGTVPAGTMYAHLIGKLSLEQFDSTHLLRWVGPKF